MIEIHYETLTSNGDMEIHEDPVFNGRTHVAEWCYMWASNSAESEPPDDCPIQCAICGKVKDD